MQEAELSFQAVVDPYARADFFVTLGPDEVALEEGYITFPTLPGGFLTKVGKMRDAFGKVNGQHPHTLPCIDRPLVTTNLIGGEDGLADAGISVARLIPNPWLFLEATGQVYQGNSEVFKAPDAERPRLRRPPARVPGPQRVHEHRPRRLDRVRPQRRSTDGHHHAPLRRRRHAALEAAAPLDLHALPRPRRGDLEPAGASRTAR